MSFLKKVLRFSEENKTESTKIPYGKKFANMSQRTKI